MDTDTLIVVAVTALAATTFIAQVHGHDVQLHSYVSAFVVGVFLSIMALVSDQLARGFAILVILVAVLKNGTATLNIINGTTKGTK
jgi:hypothetical protein